MNDKSIDYAFAIDDIKRIVGEVIGARVLELAHTGAIVELKRIGINKVGHKHLMNNTPMAVNYALSKSVSLKIDENILLRELNNIKAINFEIELLNSWVANNASYELCVNFFRGHSRRKHTELRTFYGTSEQIFKKDKQINKDERIKANQYFWDIEINRKLTAVDIDKFSKDTQLSLNKVWNMYKEYLNEKSDDLD